MCLLFSLVKHFVPPASLRSTQTRWYFIAFEMITYYYLLSSVNQRRIRIACPNLWVTLSLQHRSDDVVTDALRNSELISARPSLPAIVITIATHAQARAHRPIFARAAKNNWISRRMWCHFRYGRGGPVSIMWSHFMAVAILYIFSLIYFGNQFRLFNFDLIFKVKQTKLPLTWGGRSS